jgi:hypothetical protein
MMRDYFPKALQSKAKTRLSPDEIEVFFIFLARVFRNHGYLIPLLTPQSLNLGV